MIEGSKNIHIKENTLYQKVFFVFIAGIVLLGAFVLRAPHLLTSVEKPKITTPEVKANPFNDITLEAKAAFVYDVYENKVYFNKNAEAQLPLASLTKLITAVTALELVPDYTTVTINKESLKKDGDSGLFPNEQFSLGKLVELTLISSSNDGASAVAAAVGAIEEGRSSQTESDYAQNEKTFVRKMNAKVQALGLKQTFVLNPTGLDTDTTTGGAYGSAHDIATLFNYILKNHPEMITPTTNAATAIKSLDEKSHKIKNTNTDIQKIPELLGSKTGFTDLAGGNLVIAFDAGFNHPIIVSVLGSSEKGRFDDVRTLVFTTLSYLKSID